MAITWDYEWYTWESRFNSHFSPTSPGWMCGFDFRSGCLIQSHSALLPRDGPGNKAGWNASCSSDSWFDLACSLPYPGPELIGSIKYTPGTRSGVPALSPYFHRPRAQGDIRQERCSTHLADCIIRRECQSQSGSTDKRGAHSWDLTRCVLVNKSQATEDGKHRKVMIISTRGNRRGHRVRLHWTGLSLCAETWLPGYPRYLGHTGGKSYRYRYL